VQEEGVLVKTKAATIAIAILELLKLLLSGHYSGAVAVEMTDLHLLLRVVPAHSRAMLIADKG
jgi:hypothetical protein